ncbi:hypothetical protein LINPERHAP1_LOCUS24498, partial [Linum perenne]
REYKKRGTTSLEDPSPILRRSEIHLPSYEDPSPTCVLRLWLQRVHHLLPTYLLTSILYSCLMEPISRTGKSTYI